MDERILKWLYDINFAIDEIDSYFEGKEKRFDKYAGKTRASLEVKPLLAV